MNPVTYDVLFMCSDVRNTTGSLVVRMYHYGGKKYVQDAEVMSRQLNLGTVVVIVM